MVVAAATCACAQGRAAEKKFPPARADSWTHFSLTSRTVRNGDCTKACTMVASDRFMACRPIVGASEQQRQGGGASRVQCGRARRPASHGATGGVGAATE